MSRVRLVVLCLFLLTVLLFIRVQNFDFTNFDDPAYVVNNLMVQRGLTGEGVAWAFGQLHAEETYWHPLTWLSLMADCTVFGPQPGVMHMVNVIFHALAAALLFRALQQMTQSIWRSALVAALFACHPLQVEGVAWIAERKNVLGGVFWALTLLFYHRYVSSPSGLRYAATALALALGLMCKPALITLPCVLLLLDYWPLRRFGWGRATDSNESRGWRSLGFKRAVLEKIPLLGLSLASGIITVIGHQKLGATVPVDELPASFRLANGLVSYGRYLLKTIWPTELSVYYPMPAKWAAWQIGLSVAILLLVTVAGLFMRRSRPYWIVGWFWFLGVLVPMIGIIQASTQAMADRFAYFPLIGLFIAAVWTVADALSTLRARRWLGPALGVAMLGACMAVTWQQIGHWKNSFTLFSHSVAVTRENPVARNNLGSALEQMGRMEEAAEHYREAIRIKPGPQPYNNLGNVLDELGRFDEAVKAYQQALALRPGVALVHNNLGVAFSKQGRFDEARAQFLKAMELKPRDAHPHYLMGTLHLREGNVRAATNSFRVALALDGGHLKTLVFLSRILAANQDDSMRNGPEAVALAERAVALTGGERVEPLQSAAMAYAEVGRFEEAAKLQSQVVDHLKMDTSAPPSAVEEASRRLALYEARRPCRETATNLFSVRR